MTALLVVRFQGQSMWMEGRLAIGCIYCSLSLLDADQGSQDREENAPKGTPIDRRYMRKPGLPSSQLELRVIDMWFFGSNMQFS